MDQHYSFAGWLAAAVMTVGVASLMLLGLPPMPGTNSTVPPRSNATLGVALLVQTGLLTITNQAALSSTLSLTPFALATPLPTPSPIPPLLLPNAPAPAGGEVYLLQPARAEAVGWAQDQDETTNHLGDYNIYAGVFEGHQRIGVIQFDLATIPPGAPIVYADLTLTGLSGQWLGTTGNWQAELLASWIDQDWPKRNFHWFSRPDSAIAPLTGQIDHTAVGTGQFNTFFFSPPALEQLAARLYTGQLSVRLVGPSQGSDNLFAWDSGFGAESSGRGPVLRVITSGPAPATPPPSPTPAYVVITLTPTDDRSVIAQAAERMTATALASPLPLTSAITTPITATATATPFPPNWVTPVVIVNTRVPENAATAAWQEQVATAQAIVRGTATATPPNVWTATSTPGPTATPMIVAYERLTATPTPTGTPGQLPSFLLGKILFWSDRTGNKQGSLMMMNADGSEVALWTGGPPQWIYRQARHNQEYSPDGRYRVIVSAEQVRNAQLWIIDLTNGARRQLTNFKAIAYDPVWSPIGNQIAFVSPEPGNDELFVINRDGTGLTRLTQNDWEWDKYPSWSPDGQQIVFWSNRESRTRQIWLMNADGSNLRNLSGNEFNDWEPVWITSLAIDPDLDLEKK